MSYVLPNPNGPAGGFASGEVKGVCDVHRILDNDLRPRLVRWCSMCHAWLCDECRGNWVRRAQAMARRKIGLKL